KGKHNGYVIEGDGDHTGTIIDGFVFDKATENKYKPNGDLDYDNSEKQEHLWLAKPGCIIRNNLFVNGAEGSIRIGNGITVENNIFINHHIRTIVVQRGFGNAPVVIRNNTLAFSWEIRFGEGNGRNGHLLSIENGVNAIIDNNIFEFADNDAIRLMADPADVELTNNTFNHNLWADVFRPQDTQSVDDKTFNQLKDFKFKKLSGNQVISAGLPVDQKFLDAYLNRTAYVPGKVTMDDWNQLREMLDQPVIATGGQGPSGFMPLYPWDKALKLFPKNPKVTAGARAKDLPVSFTGVARVETNYDYQDINWAEAGTSPYAWDKFQGQRVAMKVVIKEMDNQYQLNDVSKDEYSPFTFTGPEGTDSGGLPMRAYVKKGSKAERAVRAARSYSSGTPEQWYVIKGLAKPGRQMVVEVVERAD
ncbi:MAG: right-handed parallel beta-helix repeat-containing protein, partial [Myxococcaceae bacterium]